MRPLHRYQMTPLRWHRVALVAVERLAQHGFVHSVVTRGGVLAVLVACIFQRGFILTLTGFRWLC